MQILPRMNIVQSEANNFPSLSLVKYTCCRMVGFCLLLNLMKTWKNSQNSTWISIIMVQEYVHFTHLKREYEEYVQFVLISMDKIHVCHMCMWVFEMHVFIWYVSHLEYLGLHLSVFWGPLTGQIASDFALLTHSLGHEL